MGVAYATFSQRLITGLKSPSSQAVTSHCNGEAGRRSNSATVSPSLRWEDFVMWLTHVDFCSQPLSIFLDLFGIF